ncbi:MAG: PQQ-like beta-propeller repeat protein [Spirochaetaceae bacterium]|jgi:hypothetical protein|nr:PQQ-like beta-propeller repeat protein [Spirochaetaceae bacterium]
MKLKENLKYFVITGLVFLLVYIFVGIRPLKDELMMKPLWSITLSDTVPSPEASPEMKTEGLEPFILGNRLGYFSSEGELFRSETFPQRASVSGNLWTRYAGDSTEAILYTATGVQSGVIEGAGFPFLDEDRAYLFLPGGNGVAAYEPDGTRKWIYEGTSPIVSFSSSRSATMLGHADGNLVYLDPDGRQQFSFYPGGSAYPVIIGSDVSDSGSLTACVSGLEDQRFLLLRTSGEQHKVIFHTYLTGNLRRQGLVRFDSKEEYVFYEYDGGLGIVDCGGLKTSGPMTAGLKASEIPLPGRIVSVGDSVTDNLFLVLSKLDSGYSISVFEKPDKYIASTTFDAKDAFLTYRDGCFFLGSDNAISRINVTRR